MKKTLTISLLVCAFGLGGLLAQRSIGAPKKVLIEQAKFVEAAAAGPSHSENRAQPSNSTVQTPTKSGEALLVLVVDSSPSVRGWWEKMKESAKEIVKGAPSEASVAIVGIDSEAVKSEVYSPSRRVEAIKFIDALNVGGHFTDLSRGSDAGLALIQKAAPTRCALVYLTDGKLTVPKSFRARSDFYNLLRREFTPRSNISVVVINVRGDDLANRESLPANVRIVSLKSAAGLREVIDHTLAPTIAQALITETPAAGTKVIEPQASARRNGIYLVGGLGAMLLFLVIVYAVRRRRAKRINESVEDIPANVLRTEDLELPDEPIKTEPIALFTAERIDEVTSRKSLVQRGLIRSGERIMIGNSRFADLSLEGLKQSETLQVGFDGKAVRVDRLKPQTVGGLDQVWLNQQAAPIQFNMGDADSLVIGSFSLKFLITNEDAVPSSLMNTGMSERLGSQTKFGRRRQADGLQMRSNL